MHEAVDVGALHLDDDVLDRAQPCGVDLGDRGRGERRQSNEAKTSSSASEIGLDHLAHDVERLRGHLVAAPLELVDQLWGRVPRPTR